MVFDYTFFFLKKIKIIKFGRKIGNQITWELKMPKQKKPNRILNNQWRTNAKIGKKSNRVLNSQVVFDYAQLI